MDEAAVDMSCAACHDDIHGGQFARADQNEAKTDCRRCHTPAGWKQLAFDHNRDARFKLEGAHGRVACGGCHKAAPAAGGLMRIVYKPLPVTCAGCHGSTAVRL